jgi:hypothetical protein
MQHLFEAVYFIFVSRQPSPGFTSIGDAPFSIIYIIGAMDSGAYDKKEPIPNDTDFQGTPPEVRLLNIWDELQV